MRAGEAHRNHQQRHAAKETHVRRETTSPLGARPRQCCVDLDPDEVIPVEISLGLGATVRKDSSLRKLACEDRLDLGAMACQ